MGTFILCAICAVVAWYAGMIRAGMGVVEVAKFSERGRQAAAALEEEAKKMQAWKKSQRG